MCVVWYAVQVAEKEAPWKPPSSESHPREWPNADAASLSVGQESNEGESGEEEGSTSDTEVEPATPHPDHSEKGGRADTGRRDPSPERSQPSEPSKPERSAGHGSPGGRTPTKDVAGTFKVRCKRANFLGVMHESRVALRQDRKPLVQLASEVPDSLKGHAEDACSALERSLSHGDIDLMQAGPMDF